MGAIRLRSSRWPEGADCAGHDAHGTEFNQTLCTDINGFSLHAAVPGGTDDRQALEQLCRYITRPALANERVQCNAAGHVVLKKLKMPWHDGTTHLVMIIEKVLTHLDLQVRAPPRAPACGWALQGA
ncbi:transposase [Methylibium sp.]|uniref:transposase n=1 Tax=Methylibium sp. TaxID=2067992 RepID=UPI003D144378